MTLMKDFGWLVLIVVFMPVIMAVAFVAAAIILMNSLYRWARGNTTSTSRVGAHDPSGDGWWSSLRNRARPRTPASGPTLPAPRILVPAYATSRRRQP